MQCMSRTVSPVALSLLAGCVFSTGCVSLRTTERVALENETTCLTLAGLPAPHIARLIHKGSGTAVVSDPDGQNSIFTIGLQDPEGGARTLAGGTAKTVSLKTGTMDGKGVAVMTFSEFPDCSISAEVRVTLDAEPALTRWSIRLQNPEELPLTYVRFPIVHAVPQIGETGTDDVIVLPSLPGALVVNPGENWSVNQGKDLRYPGEQSAQFVAYQDRSAGIFVGSRDSDSHPRILAAWRREHSFEFHHVYSLYGASPATWESPYPCVVGVTQGSWCESADLYKRWACGQPWCRETLADRDDIPSWWKQGPLVYVCSVRKFDEGHICNGSRYPEYLAHLQVLQSKVDGPIVPMLAGWENHRTWTAGEYFPIFDQEQAVPVIRQLREHGFRPFFFLSGLCYTFENVGVNGGTIASAAEHMDSYVIDQKTGKPDVYELKSGGASYEWLRKSYEMCVDTDFVKPFFRTVIDKAREVGVDVLQMDQTVGGAGKACYATNHNHPPGSGLYQTHAFHDLLDDMRTYGKSKAPGFVLFHEEPHEDLIPHLDGFHMREYKEKWWYRGMPGMVGIPLFTYLYHEYAIGYGGDSAGLSSREHSWSTRCQAVNLVTGKAPGIAVWSSMQSLLASHEAPLTIARNHCRLLKTRAVQHLMLGRMLHPYDLDVPPQTYHVWTTTGGKGHAEDFVEPSVLTSSWQAPDGSIGHLFVNPGDEPRSFSIQLDTRNAPAFGKCDVEIYNSAAGESFAPLRSAVTLPQPLEVDIPPWQLVFLHVRPAAGTH